MSKFEEFMQSQSQSPHPGIPIDGSFQCQVCFEMVDEAEYFPTRRWLKWTCSESHLSYIEDFML
jgi:hypothetical protein